MKFQQIRSATSIVTFGGKRFLIDPMLGPANEYPAVPDAPVAGTGNPTYDLPCPVESVLDVDAVIATHLHFDHFDEVAMNVLPKALPLFCQSEEEAAFLRTKGFEDVRVLSCEGTEFEGVTLFKTECDHGTSDEVTAMGYKMMQMSGEACGLVFKSEKENLTFYLAGDTVYCPFVDEAIARYMPQVIAVNAAGAQFPLGHALIMNQYDVQCLMQNHPNLDVIATHVEGVSHATVNRPLLRQFAEVKKLHRLYIPDDLETLSF